VGMLGTSLFGCMIGSFWTSYFAFKKEMRLLFKNDELLEKISQMKKE
jgi:hypothetical protein